MASVSLAAVAKRFGRQEVVRGIDLDIADGEFVVLVGPSGCGKSTTLRMIAGLEEADAGEIRIGGRVVNHLEPKARNIAMVFQNYAIYPHMTVARNIGFGLRRARLPDAEKQRRIVEAARLLELEPLLQRRPSELSGGQRQRVAIGRAMVREPSVFLFDEPLSNLDAQLRGQMRLEIKKLHHRLGSTVVFVTHDQVEAMTLADRIVVMRDGRIQQVGTPQALYARPANLFTARFIGSPPMNLLPGRAAGAGIDLDAAGVLPLPNVAAAPGMALLVGVRSDDLIVGTGEPGGLVLDGTVAAIEPLGPETLVHLECQGLAVVGKAPGRLAPAVGDRLSLWAPLAALHLFDPVTERAIDPLS